MPSRPKRTDGAPPPSSSSSFCVDCGRVMPEETAPNPTPRKYCSHACRTRGKQPSRKDQYRVLAQAFHHDLGEGPSSAVVMCSAVERRVFLENVDARPNDAREEARRAGRRLVNFGFESQGVEGEARPVEAVQEGRVVEASFAKGEWGIRWASR